jgi:hypothetical protein
MDVERVSEEMILKDEIILTFTGISMIWIFQLKDLENSESTIEAQWKHILRSGRKNKHATRTS